ncbi:helix-turn-helix domain-containing protein [Spirosoma endophyticum]|uniref:Transcriptional regulator, AraC family n=1 Tax=Spirosoma endophyticum TaxID=662367 RepID=A0A1I1HPN5_9BACT|nr:AraC family transcriptional regulator [Spirosoma endophyticum]SFC23403.1 transcriptional regulator, AraC family [Spirosoma endophyticum]
MDAISQVTVFRSISELTRSMGIAKPRHPLVALVSYDAVKLNREHAGRSFLIDFYKISFKKEYKGQVKYGQGYYDFDEGGLAFLAPNQLVTLSGEAASNDGYTLYFHADLIRNYSLGKHIQRYGFFNYAVNEALFLSDKEKNIVASLFESIATELENNIDAFSQDVLVSQIELLLNHSNRFYNRQFLTRQAVHHDLISQLDQYLSGHFENDSSGLPTVQQVADHLQVSPRYLTDMLRSLTGQTTQQHIHQQLIEKAKTMLSTSRLRIAEIAYQLGFEHPQSFNKLFKRLTNSSPNAFRQSFN